MARIVTWYQVYQEKSVHGFKSDGVIILDHPDRRLIGITLEEYKKLLPSLKVKQITKIADICE